MKFKHAIYTVLLTGLLLPFLSNCKKEANKMATVKTNAKVTNIEAISALSGGEVASEGASPVTARGVCWSANQSPSISDPHTANGSGEGSFTGRLTGLKANTNYYLRAYATNEEGIAFGNEVSFETNESGETVTDIDGNVYYTITIGTQVWMVENLKTTKYRNGDPISNVTDNTAWGSLTTGAYCNYNNVVNNTATYGRLYNWYSAGDSRNIAPAGWHVATDADWSALTTYLGGENAAGGKLKETGSGHWNSQSTGTTNDTGFTALPGGFRDGSNGTFTGIGTSGDWWSSTESNSTEAWYLSMYYNNNDVSGYPNCKKSVGLSVRCLKDN